MELNRTRRWFYGLTLLWVIMLLGLGSWWLVLVFKLHTTLSNLNLPELGSQSRFLNMMKWEGSFFFIFLVLLGGSLLIMYLRDMKKTKSLQAFFASLTHELKTPLASMRLQVEVIKDLIEDEGHSHEQLSNLAARLVEDTVKFESELDKSLQLSRIEQNGTLTLAPLSLERYLKKHALKIAPRLTLELHFSHDAQEILADELALNIVFRNLFENTIRHNPTTNKISITATKVGDRVELVYDDYGQKFQGVTKRLGELFYKFNSSKGSGIGLYLIKNLMMKMNGQFEILNKERLMFVLIFKSAAGVQDA
jgi:signal transduction histidine kinase